MYNKYLLRDVDKILVRDLGDMYLAGKIYLDTLTDNCTIRILCSSALYLKLADVIFDLARIGVNVVLSTELPKGCVKWTSLKLEETN